MKRYSFWRTPDGRLYKGKDGKHSPVALLEEIGISASIQPDGKITWPFPEFKIHEVTLRSVVAIVDADEHELNDTDAWSIVWKAIKKEICSQGGGVAVLPACVLQNADEIAAEYFRKLTKNFALLSTLSVDRLPEKAIQINGCEIAALKKRSSKYPFPEAVEKRMQDGSYSEHLKSTKYLTIRVKTAGRSIHEAADRAFDAVNLLRGLWTISATYGSWKMSLGSAKQEPIGVIHNGPVHSLHTLDGALATDLFWYEPDYSGDKKLFTPKNGWETLEKQRLLAVRQLSCLSYRKDMEQLLIRFAAALDQSNHDLAFLQMWGILEKITDTIGANYDETIKRATWVFPNRKIAKEQLTHLRLLRNRFVHAAKSSEKSEEIAYLIKSFVEPHLLYLLRNVFNVDSIKEYGDFLSLPSSLDILKKRLSKLALAIKLRE